MEAKNGNKPEKSLIQYSSESLGEDSAGMSEPIVEYNRVEDSIVDYSIESVEKKSIAPKVATLQTFIKKEFNEEFILDIYNKYKMSKDEFKEECNLFVDYWNEKSIN